jgi:hypothetical protein
MRSKSPSLPGPIWALCWIYCGGPKLLRRRVISLIEQSVECLDHERFVGFLLGFHNSDFVFYSGIY